MKRIEVFISGRDGDRRLGTLEYDELRGKEVSSFELDEDFVLSPSVSFLGPDIGLFRGKQYPTLSFGFGLFQDAAPDSWGRNIIRRREKRGNLRESDYLLGVFDLTRVGSLRFKVEGSDAFVNSDGENPAPPWTTLRTLEDSSRRFEEDDTDESALAVLLRPGTSLGGARPKASVTAPDGSLWIAKFPSKHDTENAGAWEMVAHDLAEICNLNVSEAQALSLTKEGTTFLVKRFDRIGKARIHMASAMTMLGKTDSDKDASYLDIADWLTAHSANASADLKELWCRIVFNIAISNTDDHLRNHGFLLHKDGWHLSPLFDVNPNPYGNNLSLGISEEDSTLDMSLALDMAEFYQIKQVDAKRIIDNTKSIVADNWHVLAKKYGLSRTAIERMSPAFMGQ